MSSDDLKIKSLREISNQCYQMPFTFINSSTPCDNTSCFRNFRKSFPSLASGLEVARPSDEYETGDAVRIESRCKIDSEVMNRKVMVGAKRLAELS